jgi:nucleoside-specific outer membrane channel protein Tsx
LDVFFINSLLTIFNLILQKHFRVEPDDKDLAYLVMEANAKKVFRDMMSNARLQAINAFMKSRGVIVNDFR